jgi:hypothetical protein
MEPTTEPLLTSLRTAQGPWSAENYRHEGENRDEAT